MKALNTITTHTTLRTADNEVRTVFSHMQTNDLKESRLEVVYVSLVISIDCKMYR
jgi:hypothetical protein